MKVTITLDLAYGPYQGPGTPLPTQEQMQRTVDAIQAAAGKASGSDSTLLVDAAGIFRAIQAQLPCARGDTPSYEELYQEALAIMRDCAGERCTPIEGWDQYIRKFIRMRQIRKQGANFR